MKKIYYEKVGKRYKPVAEYDSDFIDSFSKGTHLVMSYPGGQSRKYNINPNYAAMIAAGRLAEDGMSAAIIKASELRPAKAPITPAQEKAWKNLAKAFGSDLCTLNGSSAYDIAKAGVNAMIVEADRLMTNPMVRDAFDEFVATCKLVGEQGK